MQHFFTFPYAMNEWDVADFFIGKFNHDAYQAGLAATHALCIIGEKGSGKTHLARALAAQNGALIISADGLSAFMHEKLHRPIIVDDCDNIVPDYQDALFHAINWQKQQQQPMVIMACRAPSRWNITLPDLASRLQTFDIQRILEPDDQSLRMLLVKLFHDQQLHVEPGLIDYLAPRIERSFIAAKKVVQQIDHASLENKQKISIRLAQKILAL